jgi:hypothetical protein
MFYAPIYKMTDATADATAISDAIQLPKNDKRVRKHTAQTLPPGITQSMMKKYVVYYRETMVLKNGKQQSREYFKVESHPKLTKPWVSSKSGKISLIEKLTHANQVVTDLENTNNNNDNDNDNTANNDEDSICKRWSKHLPKYTMLRVIRETSTEIIMVLIFDRKDTTNGTRLTGAYTCSCLVNDKDAEKTAISLALQHLRDKLREKYGIDIFSP